MQKPYFTQIGMALAIATSSVILQVSAGTPLEIHTEENKPLNFKAPNGELRGVAVDVVREIQKRVGDTSPVSLGNWDLAYDSALKQPGNMVFSTARTDDREKLFKWVGPLTVVKTYFYTSFAKNITIQSLDDARKLKRIGVPSKFYYTQFLMDNKFTNLASFETPDEMVDAFKAGAIDAFTSQNLTITFLLADNKIPVTSVKAAFNFMPPKKHYLAFNIKTPDEVIKQWQKALDDIKADGTFKNIFAKYGLSPEVMP